MAARNIITEITKKTLTIRSITLRNRREKSVWTASNIVKSPHADIKIPKRTVLNHIWENLEKWADKTAIVCGITNRSYSYHQLYKYSRNFAARLRTHLSIRDGDVVCIMISNSPEYAVTVLGALQAGAAVTTINPIYTPSEVQRQLVHSDPKVLIGEPETIPVLTDALLLAKKTLPIITVKGSGSAIPSGTICFEELAIADNVDLSVLNGVNRSSDDIGFLPYSSGTTGLPKGVQLLHRNIVANCLQQDVTAVRHYDETTSTNQDIVLAIVPMYHIYGLSIILLHKLSVGTKIVTMPKFQPITFINMLKEHKINVLYAAPPLILFLSSYPGVTKQHLESVKLIASGGAPLPKSDVKKLLEKTKSNVSFINLYGMTEASPMVTTTLPGRVNYDTVGFCLSNTELKVADTELKPLGVNEVGELLIRGPQIMTGYRNNPKATKDSFTDDGWYRSGDLASIDENGTVKIVDRLKELIKVKGYQVAPAELEHILKEHPDVLDVAVIGVPHRRMGEVPKAFIVLKEGHKADAEEITSFVNKQVADFKKVKEVMFLDALPKNASGKFLRRVLKEKYC